MCNASVNSKHQHPPRATPGVVHPIVAPGLGFILDDLPQGPGFCISIKLRLVQWKSILSLNWHLDHTSMRFIGSSDLKLSPGAGFLSIFCPGAVISQKFSVQGQGI